jgi:hypothetical protein
MPDNTRLLLYMEAMQQAATDQLFALAGQPSPAQTPATDYAYHIGYHHGVIDAIAQLRDHLSREPRNDG